MNPNETPETKGRELDTESLDQVVGGVVVHEVGIVVHDVTTDSIRKAGEGQQVY